MTGREVKKLLAAANTTLNRLDRKLGRTSWAELTDAERAAWMGFQQFRLTNDVCRSWGRGRLVRTKDGSPLAWFDYDTRIHGFQRYPEWSAE